MATKQSRSTKKTNSTKKAVRQKAARPRTIQVVEDPVSVETPYEQPDLAVLTQVKRLSAIDAAARVLGEATEAMSVKQLIEAMATHGYWSSPSGKTPHATLYSAILREIKAKGNEARFKKTQRGRFAVAITEGQG